MVSERPSAATTSPLDDIANPRSAAEWSGSPVTSTVGTILDACSASTAATVLVPAPPLMPTSLM